MQGIFINLINQFFSSVYVKGGTPAEIAISIAGQFIALRTTGEVVQ